MATRKKKEGPVSIAAWVSEYPEKGVTRKELLVVLTKVLERVFPTDVAPAEPSRIVTLDQ